MLCKRQMVAPLHIRPLGDPRQDGPVNKLNLSTGENGEFGGEVALGGQLTGFANAPRLVLRRVEKTRTHAKCLG